MGSKRYDWTRGGRMADRSWTREAAVAVSADGNGRETTIGRRGIREGNGGAAFSFCPSPGLTYLDFGSGGGERQSASDGGASDMEMGGKAVLGSFEGEGEWNEQNGEYISRIYTGKHEVSSYTPHQVAGFTFCYPNQGLHLIRFANSGP
ncbi:hypothetical protein M441DRAFT_42869 [Trichoderma asperellum CBS 433.97]|uniref:Uncharacterized protein n=1 Tax=Trichoderma asperellum (strain ATCC 204424 / CBS 433.97 / NBRC 101777) TaxID=1042311 RepID=A0A2T3ZQS8_TRIA4|nr:hypothetical protein M441DRAFT_42869 [Trichoderma asperellum CBS 433.97]PTB47163.1 hypothetical protein M441DRAFT_42869 [Trichoderma asperellum CBS 433.97]